MKIRPVGAELFYEDGQTDRQTDTHTHTHTHTHIYIYIYIYIYTPTDRKRHDEGNSHFSQFCQLA